MLALCIQQDSSQNSKRLLRNAKCPTGKKSARSEALRQTAFKSNLFRLLDEKAQIAGHLHILNITMNGGSLRGSEHRGQGGLGGPSETTKGGRGPGGRVRGVRGARPQGVEGPGRPGVRGRGARQASKRGIHFSLPLSPSPLLPPSPSLLPFGGGGGGGGGGLLLYCSFHSY